MIITALDHSKGEVSILVAVLTGQCSIEHNACRKDNNLTPLVGRGENWSFDLPMSGVIFKMKKKRSPSEPSNSFEYF